MGLKDVDLLSVLASDLKARVEHEIKLETDRLLEFARTIPLGELKARGVDSVPIPRKAHTYRVRGGFKS